MKEKLRVGLLLDDVIVPAWAYRMVEIIHQSHYASIVLLVVNDSQPQGDKPSAAGFKIGQRVFGKLLDVAQEKLIERADYAPDAFADKDLDPLLKDFPVVRVTPLRKKVSDYFGDADLETIKRHDVDVLVRLGFRILRGGILNAAKYGVWSYHHGDNELNRGGPPGFWEAMESWPVTGSVLQILTEDLSNGRVLYRSCSATYPFSVNANKNTVYWKTLSFIPRKLRELHELGEDKFFEQVAKENAHPRFYGNRLYRAPTEWRRARLILGKLWQKTLAKIDGRRYFDQWCLLFDLREGISDSPWRYRRMTPPDDRFWADPHVVYRDGKYYIYVEEYLYETKKAHIALIVLDENGQHTAPTTVLDRPYHLSYPFLFEVDDELYMIPETAHNRTIELYKCTGFPDRWEFQMNLMEDVYAVDTTLFQTDGKWWMFVNMVENAGASSWDELFLFHAAQPFTRQWTPHPANPIVSDVRTARPAGRLFRLGDSLYRPSQDSSICYGYGFNINEIVKLTETEYEERLISSVKPNWDKHIVATHTFNHEHRLTLIDAVVKRRKR